MTLLFQVLGVAIGFAVIMLACGLFVTAAIRLLHALANQRAQTQGEMLGSIINGYRRSIGDHVEVGDEQELAFVIDVLTHSLRRAEGRLEFDLARLDSPADASREVAIQTAAAPLSREDLSTIVSGLSPMGKLPTSWFRSSPSSAYSPQAFLAYIRDTFATNERQSTVQFRREAARLSIVLSCILVVITNLDSLELLNVLWKGSDARAVLASVAPALLDMEQRSPDLDDLQGTGLSSERARLMEGVEEDLVQLNSVLSLADLNLGWQHSRIVQVFCVHRGLCPAGSAAPGAPSDVDPMPLQALTWEILRWLLSLGMSAWLVALGAPFWADVLRTILSRTQSLVPRPDQPRPDQPPSSQSKGVPKTPGQ